jgi:hypothetical protein
MTLLHGLCSHDYLIISFRTTFSCSILFVASVSDGLWALDESHQLLRHSQRTVKMGEPAAVSSGVVDLTSDGDWEVVRVE